MEGRVRKPELAQREANKTASTTTTITKSLKDKKKINKKGSTTAANYTVKEVAEVEVKITYL